MLPKYDEEILVKAGRLAPEKAIVFFRKKGFKITWDWRETLGKANNATFTVAKAMNMDVLMDVRKMVDKALTEGITFKQFAKELEPMLVKRGWWGSQIVDGKRVQLGSMHRMNTIYQTNTQSAYNAGRWDTQFRDRKRRPYLRLNEVLDPSTRATHEAVSGTVAKIDSAFWDTWTPPNGFNCRGRTQSLTLKQGQSDVTRDKKAGIKRPVRSKPDKGFDNNPGKNQFKPKKKDYDNDLWAEGKKMEPLF